MIKLLLLSILFAASNGFTQDSKDPAAIIKKKPVIKENQEPRESQQPKKKIPVRVTADNMRYDDNGLTAYLTGNVHADDGSIKIDADFMTIKLDKERNPQYILCEKNVVIRKENTVSNSDRAEYFVPAEKVVLTGNPKIIRTNAAGEEETSKASKIIFYRDSNNIEFQGATIEFSDVGLDKKEDENSKDSKSDAKTKKDSQ